MADGRFVKAEDGPWEEIAETSHPFDVLLDPVAVSTALGLGLDGAIVDPAVGSIACGSETCRTVDATVSPAGVAALLDSIFGESATDVPADLQPVPIALWIHPDDGFLRHLEARVTAGATTTDVILDVTRRDPPPTIERPIR